MTFLSNTKSSQSDITITVNLITSPWRRKVSLIYSNLHLKQQVLDQVLFNYIFRKIFKQKLKIGSIIWFRLVSLNNDTSMRKGSTSPSYFFSSFCSVFVLLCRSPFRNAIFLLSIVFFVCLIVEIGGNSKNMRRPLGNARRVPGKR